MWRSFIFLFLLGLGFLGSLSAHADPFQEARTALYAGQFDQAHEQARALGTGAGLVLASEALNAKLLLGQSERPAKTAKTAMKLAKQALEMDAQNEAAQMQYAVAYGFYGRHVSGFKAWRKKLPVKIKDEIEKSIAMNTSGADEARNLALRGAWHLSVVMRAGVNRANSFYGANEAEGVRSFELAMCINPDDILIVANYTLMRYVLDPKAHQQWAQDNLKLIVDAKAHNAVERQVQTRMQQILDSFDHPQDADDTEKLAWNFLN
ncbi:MAG: hypothetical protein COA69_09835 [Robiginitomaculum sp.]|nr:MAG: hypothetical protein COA69_09835 [Robiginitomaculum sp.]